MTANNVLTAYGGTIALICGDYVDPMLPYLVHGFGIAGRCDYTTVFMVN